MKLRLGILIILSFLSMSGHAGEPPFVGCAKYGCIGKIDKIYLNPNGTVQIPAMGTNSSILGCTLGAGNYLTLKPEHVHFKNMYSMMLTAHTSQKNIYLRIVENSQNCEIWYSIIY